MPPSDDEGSISHGFLVLRFDPGRRWQNKSESFIADDEAVTDITKKRGASIFSNRFSNRLPFSQSTMTDDAHPPKNSGGPQAFFEREPHVEGVVFGYPW